MRLFLYKPLQQFKVFTSSLENFLTNERGSIQLRESSAKLNLICLEATDTLNQSLKQESLEVLELKQRQREVIEKIALITGHHGKLKIAAKEIEAGVIKEMDLSLNKWNNKLKDILNKRSEQWKSPYFIKQGREKLANHYADRCQKAFDEQLSQWNNHTLHDRILKPNLIKLDDLINDSITSFNFLATFHNNEDYDTANHNWTFSGDNAKKADFSEFVSRFTFKSLGMGAGAALGYGVVTLGTFAVGIALPVLPIIGAGLLAGGLLNGNGYSEEKIRRKIIKEAYEQVTSNLTQFKQNLIQKIQQAFADKLVEAENIFDRALYKCDEELNTIEEAIQKSKEEHVAWITERQQQLDKVIEELSSSRST